MVGSRTCFHQHVVSCVDSFPLDETIHSVNPHSANPRSAYTHLVNPHSVNPHLVNPHGCQHVNWKIGYNLPTHRWVKLGTYHLDKTPSIAFVGLPTESSMGKRSWAVRICLVRMCAIRVIQNSKINRIIKLKQKIIPILKKLRHLAMLKCLMMNLSQALIWQIFIPTKIFLFSKKMSS